MDVVSITCPKCGHTESYPHPECVGERKECPGCLAKELTQGGLLYQVDERVGKSSEDEGEKGFADPGDEQDPERSGEEYDQDEA